MTINPVTVPTISPAINSYRNASLNIGIAIFLISTVLSALFVDQMSVFQGVGIVSGSIWMCVSLLGLIICSIKRYQSLHIITEIAKDENVQIQAKLTFRDLLQDHQSQSKPFKLCDLERAIKDISDEDFKIIYDEENILYLTWALAKKAVDASEHPMKVNDILLMAFSKASYEEICEFIIWMQDENVYIEHENLVFALQNVIRYQNDRGDTLLHSFCDKPEKFTKKDIEFVDLLLQAHFSEIAHITNDFGDTCFDIVCKHFTSPDADHEMTAFVSRYRTFPVFNLFTCLLHPDRYKNVPKSTIDPLLVYLQTQHIYLQTNYKSWDFTKDQKCTLWRLLFDRLAEHEILSSRLNEITHLLFPYIADSLTNGFLLSPFFSLLDILFFRRGKIDKGVPECIFACPNLLNIDPESGLRYFDLLLPYLDHFDPIPKIFFFALLPNGDTALHNLVKQNPDIAISFLLQFSLKDVAFLVNNDGDTIFHIYLRNKKHPNIPLLKAIIRNFTPSEWQKLCVMKNRKGQTLGSIVKKVHKRFIVKKIDGIISKKINIIFSEVYALVKAPRKNK